VISQLGKEDKDMQNMSPDNPKESLSKTIVKTILSLLVLGSLGALIFITGSLFVAKEYVAAGLFFIASILIVRG
jgi:hypothetical protein